MTAEGQDPSQLSVLLQRVSVGDEEAKRELAEQVHAELRQIAENQLRRERPDHTLQATALVNEAWLKLLDTHRVQWGDRQGFFGYAAKVMRSILVDHARGRNRIKRGGDQARVDFTVVIDAFDPTPMDQAAFLDLQSALEHLERIDARGAQVVNMRFFSGMTVDEVAGVLQVSRTTIEKEYRSARAWLRAKLSAGSGTA